MIFLCFSSKDRYTIAESILYHLKNYGLDTWYDYHTLIIGNNKFDENIKNGIQKSKYAILIISPNFYNCECGNMELEVIKQLYDYNQIYIFPVLYNVTASELPKEYSWIKDIIYNELTIDAPSLPTCNQIVCEILKDEIITKNYIELRSLKTSNNFIKKILDTYIDMDERNLNSKITLLYCLYTYIKNDNFNSLELSCSRILEQLFKYTKLSLDLSFKEMIIAEYALTILINEREHKYENFGNQCISRLR